MDTIYIFRTNERPIGIEFGQDKTFAFKYAYKYRATPMGPGADVITIYREGWDD